MVDSGVPNRAAGLPNTATAEIWSAVSGGSGGAKPRLPTRVPSGGTPASIDITAAPWENPPRTNSVAGQAVATAVRWFSASVAPLPVFRKLMPAG